MATTALSSACGGVAGAQSLPTGASVAYGSVGFQRSSGTLTINQGSQNAIVNYNSFSIGRRNTVNINQPNSSSVLLNRVTGSTPSTIAGHLNANGQVYLVNPNGIAFTKTGVVKVGGGFVASTLGMSDAEFLKGGKRHFRGNGASATVTNAGTITVGRGGYAALIGGEVRNRGSIAVPMGKVGLGSGEMATLDVSGDGFLQVALPTTRTGKGALVSNAGSIAAAGGTVVLDAATARAAARNAVNISGSIDAHSISGHSGSILIGGGAGGTVNVSGTLSVAGSTRVNGGTVRVSGRKIAVSGTIDASGRNGGKVTLKAGSGATVTGTVKAVGRHGKGGAVAITGLQIAFAGAHVDASGTAGGGTVKVGGDGHGAGPLPNADSVTIDPASVITADATGTGNGGSVVVWSQIGTSFGGLISAKGGAQSGDGGQVEVSSHGVLAYTGLTTLTAAKGAAGTLLLDPYNVVISDGTDANGGFDGVSPTSTYTATNTSVINTATLQTQLAAGNVTITTAGAGSDAGTITVASPFGWSTGNLLTLTAANAIAVNANISINGGGQLALNTGTVTVGSSTQPLLSFGNGASVTYAAGQSGQALTINGTAYTLEYNLATLASDVAAASSNGGRYALATNVDGSAGYTGAVVPTLNGTLEGLGHTVSNLTITGSSNNAGLIGQLNSGGTVRDIGVVGGAVSGGDHVGGLVGENYGTITQAYATGVVAGGSGSSNVGGLVGYNNSGTIAQAYATGIVAGGSGSSDLGGLVGQNTGTITQAYATGAVSGSDFVGGLVGLNIGTITQAYATGAVSGSYAVGGLVGFNNHTITQAYATGAVSGPVFVGGLVGFNSGTITQGYWDTQTSGPSLPGIGQDGNGQTVTGYTTRQLQGLDPISGSGGSAVSFSTATQLGTGGTSAFAGGTGGLYPYLTSFFPNGVQALSGLAYADRGVTPLTPAFNSNGVLTAGAVLLDVAGKQTQVTTGANGYYYVAEPAGTFTSDGTATLAYTTSNGAASGSVSGASLIAATGTTPHLDIWGSTLIASTTATRLTGAPMSVANLLADGNGTLTNSALLATAAGGNATAISTTNGVSALTQVGYIATGSAGFAVDAPVPSAGLYVQTTSGPITVTTAQTIAGQTDLSLYSAGALTFDQSVTMQGAGVVNLAAGFDTTTVPGTSLLELSFAQGSSLSFTGTNNTGAPQGTLAINGQSYTLLNALASGATGLPDSGTNDVAGIDHAGDSGRYALATNLTDAGTTFNSALFGAAGSNFFSGTFEGLGHTITDLTVNASGSGNVFGGLIGRSNGTVRDIGLLGGAISGTSNGSDAYVGGLAGYNSGTITQAYATGTSSATESDGGVNGFSFAFAFAGGLVGQNVGTITQAYATGAVHGSASGSTTHNQADVGGLVGDNFGAIAQAYATGAVSATSRDAQNAAVVGGLIGTVDSSTTTQSYATGAVSATASGGTYIGGLVGYVFSGTITNSYWDTATSGPSTPGVGAGSSSGVTGLATAALQSTVTTGVALGAAFSGGAAGGENGVYPYLKSFFPNGVQSVSGVAYADAGATPLASGTAGAVPVTVTGANTVLGTATTGANGYYYVFGQPGTIAQGASLLAYTTINGATGAANAARIAASTYATGTPILTGIDIWTPVTLLAAVTSATTLSASGYSPNSTPALPAGPALPSFLVGAIPTLAATNAQGFTIDGTTPLNLTTAFAVQTTASGAPLTVMQPITIASGGALGLLSAGALAIDAPVMAEGAVPVTLAASTATVGGTTQPNLSFGQGDAITYTDTNGNPVTAGQGGTLRINGTSYALEYSLASLTNDVGTANNNGGTYALATNVDGSNGGASYTGAVVPRLNGTLEGLGHTVSNLTVTGSSNNAALIGTLNSGTVRDIGVVGGSVSGSSYVGDLVGENVSGTITQAYATGAVSGTSTLGGLVGYSSGAITQAYATGAVSGSSTLGGLVGANFSGTITQAYATGAVSGSSYVVGGLVGGNSQGTISQAYATGAVSGSFDVGGLAGFNMFGTITRAYATGAVSGSSYDVGGLVGNMYQGTITQVYATGALSGSSYDVGGLVGNNNQSAITQAYATGAVSGSSSVGGLVGANFSGTITQAYATGAVSGSSTVGGLVGTNFSSTITQAYRDTQTSGPSLPGIGYNGNSQTVIGYTTRQLQGLDPISGSVAGGNAVYFSTATQLGTSGTSAFSGGTGGLYPYLATFFPNGVQAVSGLAYKDAGATLLTSPSSTTTVATTRPGLVSVAVNGTSLGTVTTGANGYYYAFVPAGTLPAGTRLAAITVADTAGAVVNGLGGSGAQAAATFVTASGGANQGGTNVYGGWQVESTPMGVTTLSALNTADAAAAGAVLPTGIANREISAGGGFAIDTAATLTGTLALDATGALTQSAPISAGGLSFTGSSATLTGANAIGTVAGTVTGGIDLATSGATTVGALTDATGVQTSGLTGGTSAKLVSGGNQTLAATVAAPIVLLAADGTLTNTAGANAISASNGFTIYTQNASNPTGALPADSFAGLSGTNYYNDAYSFANGSFASAVPAGNHFVYAYAASLTPVLTGSVNKTYDATTGAPTANLAVTSSGFANANGQTDTATLSFTGATYDMANAGINKTVTASGVAFASNPNNYTLATTSAAGAIGTISPAMLTYLANAASRIYGASNPTLSGTVTGFVAGQTQQSATTGTLVFGTAAGASSNAGTYAITGSGLSAINYTFAQDASNVTALSVTPASLTVTGTKVYDTTTAFAAGQLTVAGAQNGETVTLIQGTGTASSANAGTYTGSLLANLAIGVTGGNGLASNYALPAAGTLTIGPAMITVAGATGVNKTYDGTTALPAGATGFTTSGIYASDAVSVTASSAAYASPNAGPEPVNVAGLTLSGTAAGNYLLSAPSVTGSGTISPAMLTYLANAATRTYGASNPALSGTVTGFVAGQTQQTATTGTLVFATSAGVSSNAGSYVVTGSGLNATNYTFAQAASNTMALTVSPAPLTVSGAKVYDTTTAFAAGQLTVAGAQNGETVTLIQGTGTASSANAGTYTGSLLANLAIGVTGGNGLASNYALPATGTLTTSPATITVAGATGVTKTYDGTMALPAGATGFTTSGIYASDAVSVTASSATYASPNAGPEPVNVAGLTLSGTAAGNYVLSATGVTGSGTVSPAMLTYLANAASRTYGASNPTLSGTVTGFVAGQTQQSATTGTLTFGTTATLASNVGSYVVTGSGLNATNYTFAQAASNTMALTVSPALLTMSGAKTYDTTTGFATSQLTVAGAQNGEMVTLTQGTGASSSANAGTYAGSPLANLAIGVTGGNALASNYALPGTGTLTISPATITVAGATGVNKTYDGTTALPAGATGFTTSGIYAGDAANVAVTAGSAAYASPNAGPEPVSVAGLTLSGTAAGNYVLSGTSATGSGTISSPAPVVATVPGPLVITPSLQLPATDLASTAQRDVEVTFGRAAEELPLLSRELPGSDGTFASSIVRSLSDPRFDNVVVCFRGFCTVVPVPTAEMRTFSQLEPRRR